MKLINKKKFLIFNLIYYVDNKFYSTNNSEIKKQLIKNKSKETGNQSKEIKNESKEIKNESKEIKNEFKEIENESKEIKNESQEAELMSLHYINFLLNKIPNQNKNKLLRIEINNEIYTINIDDLMTSLKEKDQLIKIDNLKSKVKSNVTQSKDNCIKFIYLDYELSLLIKSNTTKEDITFLKNYFNYKYYFILFFFKLIQNKLTLNNTDRNNLLWIHVFFFYDKLLYDSSENTKYLNKSVKREYRNFIINELIDLYKLDIFTFNKKLQYYLIELFIIQKNDIVSNLNIIDQLNPINPLIIIKNNIYIQLIQ